MASLPSSDDPHVLVTRPWDGNARWGHLPFMALHVEDYQQLCDEVERLRARVAELEAELYSNGRD